MAIATSLGNADAAVPNGLDFSAIKVNSLLQLLNETTAWPSKSLSTRRFQKKGISRSMTREKKFFSQLFLVYMAARFIFIPYSWYQVSTVWLFFILFESEIVSCAENSCFNGGTCLEPVEPNKTSGNITCICPSGYTGERCVVELTRTQDDIQLGQSSVYPTLLNTSTWVLLSAPEFEI